MDKNLSLEQQFNLATFTQEAQKLSKEQAIELLVRMYKESLVKDVIYQELVTHKWGA